MPPLPRHALVAVGLCACVPKAPVPAWQGAEVLAQDAAPMGVTAEQVLARHTGLRTFSLEWDGLPADIAATLGDLDGLVLDVRAHPTRSPSLLREEDREICPAPPCFLVPLRIEHNYDGQLTGRGNGALSIPDRDPDTWRLVPYPAGLKTRGPKKAAVKEAWEDAFWIALTSFVDPIPLEPADDHVQRATLMVNLTFDNGVRQDGIGLTLEPLIP